MAAGDPLALLSAGEKPVRESASQRVAQKLLDLVQSGSLKAGDTLPTEHQITAALQVSRPVVREALRGLAIMGVVESRQGGRCTVTDLSASRLAEPFKMVIALDEENATALYEARVAVECEMIRLAAQRADEAQIARLAELARAGFELAGDPVSFRVMDKEFHGTLMEASRNPFLQRMAASLYELGMEYRRVASETPGVTERSAREHAAIVTALKARDPLGSAEAMRAHLQSIARSTQTAMAALAGEHDSAG